MKMNENLTEIKWTTEKRKLEELIPADYNPRKLSKKEKENLGKSITKFGYVETIDINQDNTVIGGHQRLKVLADLGYNEIEVRVPNRLLTKEEEKELNIRLNKNTGAWDYDLLADFEMDMLEDIGFDSDELELIFKDDSTQEVLEDGFVEILVTEPIAKLGDLYKLGEHRLLCGDCSIKGNAALLLNCKVPVLMVTDPPYGVNYEPEWRENRSLGVGKMSTGKVKNDDVADWSHIYDLYQVPVVYVWHAAWYTAIIVNGLLEKGYQIVSQIIWAKPNFAISRGDYHWKHEPCWYAVKKGSKHNWQGARDQSTVWEIKNNNFSNYEKEEKVGHGTQKPVECMLRPILNNSKKGDIICDPFLGSGTTLIAAEQSDRICYGMEIDPVYIDAIIKRWEKFTNQKAIKII